MFPDFTGRLRAAAEVIVRVGLNLQPGQRILAHDPYELQGVARSAEVIVHAVHHAALAAGAGEPGVDVIWGDGARLRAMVEARAWSEFERLLVAHARRLQRAIDGGDALLFLAGSQPRLMAGLREADVAEARRIAWESFGPLAQQLVGGATNWTCVPAPSPAWAAAAFEFLPGPERLTALWATVFSALRCSDAGDVAGAAPVERWRAHLAALAARRSALEARRARTVRYRDAQTDLTVTLPAQHVWCTAQLTTRGGVPFVANLPTEEVFTAPDRASARGWLRAARPIVYAGSLIENAELEFRDGAVVAAGASRGAELLQALLETDDGARRLGEIAVVDAPPAWAARAPAFHHVLLDENAAPHVGLGDAYAFCHRGPTAVLNRSLVHVDIPLTAPAELA